MSKKRNIQKVLDESVPERQLPSDLDSIYFDTNVLEMLWPAFSMVVEKILAMANDSGKSVYLPEVVRRELDAHWPRRLTEARDAVRLLIAAGIIKPLELPSKQNAQPEYDRSVNDVLAKYNFETIPLPKLSCGDLLDYAIRQDVAFENDGKNLQDTLVVLSVVEHMVANSRKAGVIVSWDGVFTRKWPVLKTFFEERNLQLFIATPEAVLDALAEKNPKHETQAGGTTPEEAIGLIGLTEAAQRNRNLDFRLEPMSWFRHVGDPSTPPRVIQYRVEGLPSGHEAWIGDFGHGGWRILYETSGISGHWSGTYKSVEAAAAALQKEISRSE